MKRFLKKPRLGFHDPGNRAVTHIVNQYPLPDGLQPGTEVEILSFEHGYCTVRSDDGREWPNVYMAALQVIAPPTQAQ